MTSPEALFKCMSHLFQPFLGLISFGSLCLLILTFLLAFLPEAAFFLTPEAGWRGPCLLEISTIAATVARTAPAANAAAVMSAAGPFCGGDVEVAGTPPTVTVVVKVFERGEPGTVNVRVIVPDCFFWFAVKPI